MINLIKSIIKRIRAFFKLQRMSYEMKKSQNCLDLIISAILSEPGNAYDVAITDEINALEASGISLASDLRLMSNCLFYLEDLEDVTVDDSVDWSEIMARVSYVNKGLKSLSETIVWFDVVKSIGTLSTNQVIYLDKYKDIVTYLLCTSQANQASMEQV
jgi:hypothetical protein